MAASASASLSQPAMMMCRVIVSSLAVSSIMGPSRAGLAVWHMPQARRLRPFGPNGEPIARVPKPKSDLRHASPSGKLCKVEGAGRLHYNCRHPIEKR
jgi:hypothetical protein